MTANVDCAAMLNPFSSEAKLVVLLLWFFIVDIDRAIVRTHMQSTPDLAIVTYAPPPPPFAGSGLVEPAAVDSVRHAALVRHLPSDGVARPQLHQCAIPPLR